MLCEEYISPRVSLALSNTYLGVQHGRDKPFELHYVDLKIDQQKNGKKIVNADVPPPSLTLAPTQTIAVMENGERTRRLSGPL